MTRPKTKRKREEEDAAAADGVNGGGEQLKRTMTRASEGRYSKNTVTGERMGKLERSSARRKNGSSESFHFHWETIQMLNILPEEVWNLILAKIRKPEALESLSNASPFFRFLLWEKRVVFLFPMVIMSMGDTLSDSIRRGYNRRSRTGTSSAVAIVQCCNTCGRKRTDKWFSELLGVRLVCSLWSTGVGLYCQSQELKFTRLAVDSDKFWWADAFNQHCQPVQQFLQHFQYTHYGAVGTKAQQTRSPFINGVVELEIGWDEFRTGRIESVLSLYGDHVLYSKITFSLSSRFSQEDSMMMGYSKIRQFLRMMPRLRKLDISFYVDFDEDRTQTALEHEIMLNPLPRISSLEFLKVSIGCPLFKELLRSNSQLTCLEVDRCMDETNLCLNSLLPSSLNLKQFKTSYYSAVEFEKLRNFSWSLEKLHIHYLGDCIKWPKVFCVLSNKAWAKTLTDVRLTIPKNHHDKIAEGDRNLLECVSFSIHLPRVKSFEVSMSQLCSIDFFLPMKNSLEYLRIGMNLDDADKKRLLKLKPTDNVARQQKIQFLGYSENLYDSNIWNIFPKLKLVIRSPINAHGTKVYSRRQWMILKSESQAPI